MMGEKLQACYRFAKIVRNTFSFDSNARKCNIAHSKLPFLFFCDFSSEDIFAESSQPESVYQLHDELGPLDSSCFGDLFALDELG